MGVFGQSFGGAQAAQCCCLDARCKAVVDIDGTRQLDVTAYCLRAFFDTYVKGESASLATSLALDTTRYPELRAF